MAPKSEAKSSPRAGGIVAVWMNVPEGQEFEVNDFYELEHTVHIVEVDGFLSGYRYFNAQGRLRFMTLYETVNEHAEPGPGFQRYVNEPGPRAIRVRKLFGTNTRRLNCLIRHDTGSAGTPGGLLILHSSEGPEASATSIGATSKAATSTATTGSAATATALRTSLPGALRYRAIQSVKDPAVWLEIWDFGNLEAARAAMQQAPARRNAEVEIYEAIGTPRVKRADGTVVPVSTAKKAVQG